MIINLSLGNMTETASSTQSVSLDVVVKGQDGRELLFKIKPNVPLAKLMEIYCTTRRVPLKDIRFIYNHKRITKRQTPAQLGIMNGDQIDAMIYVHGGGCKAF